MKMLKRNQKMLDEDRPDLVVAFYNKEVTPGTAHMVKISREAGIPVLEYGIGVIATQLIEMTGESWPQFHDKLLTDVVSNIQSRD